MLILTFGLSVLAGCGKSGGPAGGPPAAGSPDAGKSLAEARKGFQTKLISRGGQRTPPDNPPPKVFRLVSYPAGPGPLAAYLTPDQGEKNLPAIVWITGGDCNSIDDVWSPGDPGNDQSAAQYRQRGIVMMYPSLRGGNDNPGRKEGFFGEVDDVLAAAAFLAKQPHVDPKRIYLGGHSTGGTLVLLVAAAAPPGTFRGVFSFGPVHDVAGYGPNNEFCPFDMSNPREFELRAPGRWLHTIQTPTFVLEGTREGNWPSVQLMQKSATNPQVHFLPVKGADHFSLLGPVNRLIAGKIVADRGATPALTLTEDEVNRAAAGR
jgi:acetyl esterase/lipase